MSVPADDELLRAARLAELGLMTAALAHELRQPLFAIKSLAQLAEAQAQASGGDGVISLLRSLQQQVGHMERLTDHITQYSRVPERTQSPVDGAAAVEQAVSMLLHRARRKGVTLRLNLGNPLRAMRADPVSTMQVMVNVIQNAIDASPQDGQVSVSLDVQDAHVVLLVQDQGPGVPEALSAEVFEPFFTTKDPGEGTGLGLSLCRQVMDTHGGDINFDRVPSGARVRVRWLAWESPSVSLHP